MLSVTRTPSSLNPRNFFFLRCALNISAMVISRLSFFKDCCIEVCYLDISMFLLSNGQALKLLLRFNLFMSFISVFIIFEMACWWISDFWNICLLRLLDCPRCVRYPVADCNSFSCRVVDFMFLKTSLNLRLLM